MESCETRGGCLPSCPLCAAYAHFERWLEANDPDGRLTFAEAAERYAAELACAPDVVVGGVR